MPTFPQVRDVRVTARKSVTVRIVDGMVRDDTHLTTFGKPRINVVAKIDEPDAWPYPGHGIPAPAKSDEGIETATRLIEMALVAGPEMAACVDMIGEWAYDKFGRRVLLDGQAWDGKGLRRPVATPEAPTPRTKGEPRTVKPPVASTEQATALVRSMGYDGPISKAMIRAAKTVLRDRAKR